MVNEEQPPGRPEGAPVPAEPPPRRRPALLALGIALVCVVAVGMVVGLVAYHRATAIDRSEPDTVVDRFLHATAVERDSAQASLFVCSTWAASDAVRAATANLPDAVKISWSTIRVAVSGDNRVDASVSVRLTVAGMSDVETWRLTVVLEDGWRVCSLRREGSTQPTATRPSAPQ